MTKEYRKRQLEKLKPAEKRSDHYGSIRISDGENRTHTINITGLEFEQIKNILINQI